MGVTLYLLPGTGSGWDFGYQYDLAVALTEWNTVWEQLTAQLPGFDEVQGVSCPADPNGIPQAFPMQKYYLSSGDEMARLMRLRNPAKPWAFASYSQGAIVSSNIMDRCGITKSDTAADLGSYAQSFRGGITFGNPRREQHHMLPGGIDPGGHGIVTPNLVGTPTSVYDFAAGSNMVGSPGQDLYATCGYSGNDDSIADEEAVWEVVRSTTLTGKGALIEQVLGILVDPLNGGVGAVEAILAALDFFVVKGVTPHTSYQFTQPIASDQRDCWALAYTHLADIGAAG